MSPKSTSKTSNGNFFEDFRVGQEFHHATPRTLTEAFTGPDRAAAKRAFDAMMTMKKIDVAAIDAARRG